MRWQKHKKKQIANGEQRVIQRFLLFPRCIDGEYRWLELVKIRQTYCYGM